MVDGSKDRNILDQALHYSLELDTRTQNGSSPVPVLIRLDAHLTLVLKKSGEAVQILLASAGSRAARAIASSIR